ncbi:MAG: RluA family pseudouridine synthase [Mycoplasmataceae bacterium]|nr:RluA family pseudouridine synthase [Mycoplasmataceae bacterium]
MKINETLLESQRIDLFLVGETGLTRNKIKQLILAEQVIVNGKVIIKPNTKLIGEIEISLNKDLGDKPLQKWNELSLIKIIKQTNDYLILDKPSGLSVHPGAGNENRTLVNLLLAMNIPLAQSHTNRPGIVHRLDKDTTGIIVIAKNDEFYHFLQEQFITRSVKKIYYGLIVGNLEHQQGEINLPLSRDHHNRKRITVSKFGKKAVTLFKVVERFTDNDLIQFDLKTGRTHQIRAQMQYLKHPLYNDPVYGVKVEQEGGQYLHASKISFLDLKQEKVTYEVPLPPNFEKKLKEIKKV